MTASLDTSPYIGRFAPSPTGPLHFGSLIAATASYLEAKKHQGSWLLRMEDVDETRCVKGAADSILRTLQNYGFAWQGQVVYQSQRKELYTEALAQLSDKNLIYRCDCSRKDLQLQAKTGEFGVIYPDNCRQKNQPEHLEHAIRIKTDNTAVQFNDAIMGPHSFQLHDQMGDFVIRRRDGLFAYQLAVVVDDALQNISHVVRGYDLLDSTPRQIYLQGALNYCVPDYTHLPLAVNEHNEKLSKKTAAPGLTEKVEVRQLVSCMNFLGQAMPTEFNRDSLNSFWQWAFENWDNTRIPHTRLIKI